MSIFREIPPTAGLPIYLKDFLSLLKPGSLEGDLKNYLGLEFIRVTYSGTAALYLILESLKELSSKKSVIIPAYVCPLVPLAIKRAGLKVEVCDIENDSFDFDLRALENLCSTNSDILAVVAVHLAGISLDFAPLEKIVKRHKIFIIEDCAQSLGATYRGQKTGTLGDFSFFSLCRGKGLTIYEGGVAATNKKEYAQILDTKIDLLVKGDLVSESLKILELFGYWVFYRPFLFWLVFRFPQIFWNLRGNRLKALTEYFTVGFPIHRVSNVRKSIGHAAFYRLEREIDKQREKVLFYLDGLKGIKGTKVIKELPDTRAIYPYLTLIFDESKVRDKALKLFEYSGLGVFLIYACAITDYDYLKEIVPARPCPNARYLASRTITLTTSTFLNKKDLALVLSIIQEKLHLTT
jgi:dTDP-4-amino-4,6-dideoxygalactose transaminase